MPVYDNNPPSEKVPALVAVPCSACGAPVFGKTRHKKFCADCMSVRRAEQLRRIAETARRKRGVPQVKGTVINCAECGCEVTLNRRADTKYCRPCYLKANGMQARDRSRARFASETGRKHAYAYQRERRISDPKWALDRRMSCYMANVLNGKKAGRRWQDLVGYTVDDLIRHLERQFLPGMTWENRSEWHVDHIVPLASFSFTSPDDEEFKAAWALTNLRPLWARENVRKSATRLFLV